MFDSIALVSARFVEKLDGYQFSSPDGSKREMKILPLGVQSKKADVAESDYPFSLLRLRGGSEGPGSSGFVVEILTGLFINPDLDGDGNVDNDSALSGAAMDEMLVVLTAYRKLGDNGNYSPYSLESIKWQIGDKDGMHPSPDYYQLTAMLEFIQAPVF